MHDRELYAKLLGLMSPWDVVEVEVDLEGSEVRVFVAYRSDTEAHCPECKSACARHDTRRRSWRHLDTMQYQTLLIAEVPRVRCGEHGVRQVDVPWGEERSRFTALFECLVIDWLLEASFSAVARKLGLTWDQVDGIQQRAVRRGLARRETALPTFIGVDETSFQKRHEYVTVVSDLDSPEPRVLHVADDRKEATLAEFFDALDENQREAIAAVAMDMHAPYIKATRAALAERADDVIVFDKFHIVKHFGDAVDRIRRQEHKSLRSNGDDALKGTKYMWLRSPEAMDAFTRRRFAVVQKASTRLARAWAMKDAMSRLWFYKSEYWADRAWRGLIGWLQRSRLAPMVRLGRTLRRHYRGVLNAVLSGVTNARAEAINARIQRLKKMACGYRNRERFRAAIYFHLGGLDLYPEKALTHTES